MIPCDTFDGVKLSGNPLGLNRNRVAFSCLQQAQVDGLTSPTVSIKFPLQGTEHYLINGRRIAVGAGRFLVVDGTQPYGVYIRSVRNVAGLCLHLQKAYLYDVYLQLTKPAAWLLDHPFEPAGPLHLQQLVSAVEENSLGHYLQTLPPLLNRAALQLRVDEESFFFQLAGHLLRTQSGTAVQGAPLQVQKSSTQKELLQRLAHAKALMEGEEGMGMNISTLARKCSLSPAHLFRCFKQVYGLSPHRYALQHKLQIAAQLLLSSKMTPSEAAVHCGFADLPSFSKAFKKAHGASPQHFKKKLFSLR